MKEIPLTKGFVALVDDEDYEKLSQVNWFYEGGYAKSTSMRALRRLYSGHHMPRKGMLMHRLLLNAPPELEVDHRFRDTLDNQKLHLRLATKAQNMRNAVSSVGVSQYKGVYRHQANGTWIAQIGCERQQYLGSYDTELAAALAYDRAACAQHGEFARLNFPDNPQAQLPFAMPAAVPPLPSTGYIGVYTSGANFVGRANAAGKRIHLGSFSSAYDAALYRDHFIEKNNLKERMNFQ